MKLKTIGESEFKNIIDVASFFDGRQKFPRGTKSVLQAIKTFLARQRQGTVATKTKGLVRGGGKKPFKQKGTGNARQGSSRSPLMPGGGTAHGPQPRPWNPKINRKEANLAFKAAFVDHLKGKSLFLVDGFEKNSALKTKNWRECFKDKTKYLFLTGDQDSVRGIFNLGNVKMVNSGSVNVYDLVWADAVVFRQSDEIQQIKDRLAK